MKRRYVLGLATAAVIAGGAGLDAAVSHAGTGSGHGSAAAPGTPASSSPMVTAAALGPGRALVDGAGRTLYLFEADSPTTSACSGACAQVWPPLIAHGAAPIATGPVQATLFGTARRSDGTQQITYNGHPLYYYAADRNPGDVNGQGLDQFGAGWYVLTPAGDEIDSH
jgi:predicted lipoprotein with Yx(FWY)xxD motif